MGFRRAPPHATRHVAGGPDSLDQAVIVSTGGVPGAGAATVTVTWPTPCPDTSYVPKVTVVEGSAGATLHVARIVTKTAAAITVRVENDSLAARTGEIHAEATRL